MDLLSGQQWGNRPTDTAEGEEGDGEMHGESGIETYNATLKTGSQPESAVRLGNSNRGSAIG